MTVGKIYIDTKSLFSHVRPINELIGLQKYEAYFNDNSLRDATNILSIPFWYNKIIIELNGGEILYEGIYPSDKLEPYLNGKKKEFQLIINNELQSFIVILQE